LRGFVVILAVVMSLFGDMVARAQVADTSRFEKLGAKLDEYFASLAGESVDVQNRECDYIIESCRDSLTRQYVTLRVYGHYVSSKIMGDEAVAVHVADKWILSGKVAMKSEIDMINARIFADFHRSSLIGMKAPPLEVKDTAGADVALPLSGRYSVLYFYDTDCISCRVETLALREMLGRKGLDGTLVAFYVGAGEDAWKRYRESSLMFGNVEVMHVWDPEGESDFRRLYGVLKTPSMLLVGPDGVIVGRGLDTGALEILLDRIDNEGYEYGSDEAYAMLDKVFAGGPGDVEDILKMGRFMEKSTLGEGDTLGFKRMAGDMLYWLTSRRGRAYKMAVGPFAEEFVLGKDVWRTREDSLRVVGLAQMVRGLSELAPEGEKVADVKAWGVLMGRRLFGGVARREGEFSLRRLGGAAFVVFYTHGCPNCEETLAAADRVTGTSRKKVLLVDMDEVFSRSSEMGGRLLESFDLSALPFVLELDRKGVVVRKYVDFAGN